MLFISLLESILSRLARAGFKFVVAHGHGPSTNLFDRHRQEWSAKFSLELFICWDTVGGDEDTGIQTDHAAANETSLVMALHPELVEMDQLSKDPEVWPLAIIGKEPRMHASPEMGERVIQKNLDWMEAVLRESLERSSHERHPRGPRRGRRPVRVRA